MTRFRSASFPLAPSIGVALSLLLAGCSTDTRTSAQFLASTTVAAPGLVKLEAKSISESRVVVDVLIHGPEPDLDLNAFVFGIQIGDPDLVRFVPQASYLQTALAADADQSIDIDVDGTSDPSLVAIVVQKRGSASGNGFASESAIVIELTFEAQGDGTTSLAFVGLGENPPTAFDSSRAPIAAVRFDAEKSGVSVVTTENGY